MAIMLLLGCNPNEDAAKSLFDSKPRLKISVAGITGVDGAKMYAFLFNQSAYFYIPDALADGHSIIGGGGAVVDLSPAVRDGAFYVYAFIDVIPDDGPRPMPGDFFAGPFDFSVVKGGGKLDLTAADFLPVNVLARVDNLDPEAEGVEVRVRVGAPDTPCQSTVAVEAYGVIRDGFARMGLAGLPDGTYSVCALVNMDNSPPVTGLPGGNDLVAADGGALTVAGGSGTVIVPQSALHAIPKLGISLATAGDGQQVIVMAVDIITMTPQAFGLAEFQGGAAEVPLLVWLLDGNYLATALLDMDSNLGISMGDIVAGVLINVAGATVLPPIQDADFKKINVIATINLAGNDGKLVMMMIYPQGAFCSGLPAGAGLAQVLSNGTVNIPAGELPNGNYEACPLVDVDGSMSATGGDLTAMHIFTVSGTAQFTIAGAEFFPIP